MTQLHILSIKMRNQIIIVITVLLASTYQTVYFRMQATIQNTLKPNDTLTSTLGIFTMTLMQTGCILQVSNFTNNAYNIVGNYSPSVNITTCANLTLLTNSTGAFINTDNGSAYLSLKVNNCTDAQFNIDDTGNIHLICLNGSYSSVESVISNFNTIQPLIRVGSNSSIGTNSVINATNNTYGWSVVVNSGILTLTSLNDATIFLFYEFDSFIVTPNNVYDKYGQGWFNTSLLQVNFYPRCGYISGSNFNGPFVGVFDPFWPIINILDQGGYEILTIRYPNNDCFATVGVINGKSTICTSWVCPTELFEFNGNCVSVCPAKYYAYIKRNQSRCVLNCEEGAYRDNTTMMCYCGNSSRPNITCPANTITYIKGCNCTANGMYYDSVIGCTTLCSPGFFGYLGICVSCPIFCKTCGLSTAAAKSSFISCTICNPGYQLDPAGNCLSSCNLLQGNSIVNSVCSLCKDANCFNCTANVLICTQCNPMYTLNAGACSQNCSHGGNATHQSFGQSVCLNITNGSTCITISTNNYDQISFIQCMSCPNGTYIYQDRCVTDCPSTNPSFINDPNGKACLCKSGININGVCYSNCPIKMYYNITLQSCLSCPFGCISCQSTAAQCTSCGDGFILYPYHPNFANSTCIYNSPFADCSAANQFMQDIESRCVPMTTYGLYSFINSCYSSIPGCLICIIASTSVCVACNTTTYLYNNTCVTACPTNTFAYRQTCVANNPRDSNCVNSSITWYINWGQINNTLFNNSVSYLYYTGAAAMNNPVGYIFNQQPTSNDTSLKTTYFVDYGYYCSNCNSGFAPDTATGLCIACPQPCQTCYYPNLYSCVTCISGYTIANGSQCLPSSTVTSAPCFAGQYRNSLALCVNTCNLFYVNSTYINCTESCPPGTTPTRNLSATFVSCVNVSGSGAALTLSGAGYLFVKSTLLFIIPSSPFSNTAVLNQVLNLTNFNISSRLLMANVTTNYITYQTANTNNLVLMDLSSVVPYAQSVDGLLLADSKYGFAINNSRPYLVTRDVAYIGYFISIVLIILLVVYSGNDMMYKVENTFILAQTVYYMLFTKSILNISLSQFYYGFFFSHIGFIPNIFYYTIPDTYYEDSPLSYKLVTLDANVVRNAGFSFTIIIFFTFMYFVVFSILYACKTVMKRHEAFSIHIARNTLIGFVELCFVNIFYFSVAQIKWGSNFNTINNSFNNLCIGVAIVFIIVVLVYAVVRFVYNKIAGLYCFKKILIALVLACTFNDSLMAFLFLIEAVFTACRFFIETPFSLMQNIFLWAEQLLIMIAYAILLFNTNSGATIIIITLILSTFLCVLIYDLTRVYTDSKNQWDYQDDEEEKQPHQIPGTDRLQG